MVGQATSESPRQISFDSLDQFLALHRFRQKALHSVLHAAIPVIAGAIGRDRDDRGFA